MWKWLKFLLKVVREGVEEGVKEGDEEGVREGGEEGVREGGEEGTSGESLLPCTAWMVATWFTLKVSKDFLLNVVTPFLTSSSSLLTSSSFSWLLRRDWLKVL